jgi:hypothetical protein
LTKFDTILVMQLEYISPLSVITIEHLFLI